MSERVSLSELAARIARLEMPRGKGPEARLARLEWAVDGLVQAAHVALLRQRDLDEPWGRARVTVEVEGTVRDFTGDALVRLGWLEFSSNEDWDPVPGAGRPDVSTVMFPMQAVRRIEWLEPDRNGLGDGPDEGPDGDPESPTDPDLSGGRRRTLPGDAPLTLKVLARVG